MFSKHHLLHNDVITCEMHAVIFLLIMQWFMADNDAVNVPSLAATRLRRPRNDSRPP